MRLDIIIVADLGQIKAFKVIRDELTAHSHVQLIDDQIIEMGRKKLKDIDTDKQGEFAVVSYPLTGERSVGERHNEKLEIRRKLICELSKIIGQIIKKYNPSAWALSAPAEILPRIIENLDQATKKNLIKTISADLTKIDKTEILQRFGVK
ncbi:host attachment protein [Candidatus Methylacidiphilum infernorum]|uniref:Host attachment protein n=1 Tax=Candidatus Methylacidiphilum infernorum TaxID=511746 RepID=A0ABX7PXE4_9BACT|nr:host attachment protein [Candidatus Methylacidiphilum infernorum]QSR87338.1 host attachment protein [Candidatus Methylacidiphilum infernorum]